MAPRRVEPSEPSRRKAVGHQKSATASITAAATSSATRGFASFLASFLKNVTGSRITAKQSPGDGARAAARATWWYLSGRAHQLPCATALDTGNASTSLGCVTTPLVRAATDRGLRA